MRPAFATVQDLIKEKESIVGACCVLLIWPEPSGKLGRSLVYDVEAIQLLNPRVVVLVYETHGGAGSDSLHEWLQTFHPNKPASALNSVVRQAADFEDRYLDRSKFPRSKYTMAAFHRYQRMKITSFFRDWFCDEICLLLRCPEGSERIEQDAFAKLKTGVTTGEPQMDPDGCIIQ